MALGTFLQGYLSAKDRSEAAGTRQIQEYGVLQKIIAQQQAVEQEKKLRVELESAPTPEAKLAVAQKYMGANQLGTSIQGSQDREALREATAAQRDATLGFQRESLVARLSEAEAARLQRAADAKANRDQRMDELNLRLKDA